MSAEFILWRQGATGRRGVDAARRTLDVRQDKIANGSAVTAPSLPLRRDYRLRVRILVLCRVPEPLSRSIRHGSRFCTPYVYEVAAAPRP